MEYKVKFKAVVPGLVFPQTFEGMEIYKADTAQAAIAAAKKSFSDLAVINGVDTDEVYFSIIDVEKL